ncbi:MAG: hypothetical protein ACM3TR_19955 [Caulobacteraceae bacterium]
MTKVPQINNPLTAIGFFVAFVEACLGIAVHANMTGSLKAFMVISMILMALGSVIGFFVILFTRPERFYSPGDFKDEGNFVQLIKGITTRVNDLESLTALIDSKIEEMPFYQFCRLTPTGQHLFLSTYHYQLGFDGTRETPSEILNSVKATGGNDHDIQDALKNLHDIGWICLRGNSFDTTTKGEQAHGILKEFVYGRWA